MGNWYIDRSRNISSVFKEGTYTKLSEYVREYDNNNLSTKKLIGFLGINGKNPNAYLTYLRDLGLITLNNEPTNFLRACIDSQLTAEQVIVLILIKRDDNKISESTIKPFVVISKFLNMLIENDLQPILNWNHCVQYLMNVEQYNEINMVQYKSIDFDMELNEDKGVLDIWFNALLDSKMFVGTKREVTLD